MVALTVVPDKWLGYEVTLTVLAGLGVCTAQCTTGDVPTKSEVDGSASYSDNLAEHLGTWACLGAVAWVARCFRIGTARGNPG